MQVPNEGVEMRLYLADRERWRGKGGPNSLDDDMVSVGVRRQSRSPPDTAMSVRGQCPWLMTRSVWEFAGKTAAPPTLPFHLMVNVGLRRQSRSRPNIAKPQPPSTAASFSGQRGSSQTKAAARPQPPRFFMAAKHWHHKL